MDWEKQDDKFTSFTMKNLSLMRQKIMAFISITSKWLNPALFLYQSSFEKEGSNFRWLDRLVNRLENTSRYSRQGFQQPWYESSRKMDYKWFDPRHWMEIVSPGEEENVDGNIHNTEQPWIEPGHSPFTARSTATQQNAVKISNKFNNNLHMPINCVIPETAIPGTAEFIEPALKTQIVQATGRSNPETFINQAPALMPHIATLFNMETSGPQIESNDINSAPGQEEDKRPTSEPKAVKHHGPKVEHIQNAIAQFLNRLDNKRPVPSAVRHSIIQPRHASISSFVKEHFDNKGIYPESPLLTEMTETEFPAGIDLALAPQNGLFNENEAITSTWADRQLLTTDQFEDKTSMPFYAPERSAHNFGFHGPEPVQRYYGSESFAFPMPGAQALPFQSIPDAAVPSSAGNNGINNGPIHLAMAPLLRPMPAELALRPMPEELRETGTPESSEETHETEERREPDYDPEALAAEVYAIIKRRILVEKERSRGSI